MCETTEQSLREGQIYTSHPNTHTKREVNLGWGSVTLTLGLNFSTETSKKCSRSSSTGRSRVLAAQDMARDENTKTITTRNRRQHNKGRGEWTKRENKGTGAQRKEGWVSTGKSETCGEEDLETDGPKAHPVVYEKINPLRPHYLQAAAL